MSNPLEIKDEIAYISLRDLAVALNIPDNNLSWDITTQTAILKEF